MSDKIYDEEAIFKIACQIASPEARVEYLHQICGNNETILGRVTALLRVYEEESGFLESPLPGVGVTTDRPFIPEKPGTQIGPYKLLQVIGEGGMGVVYMAEQTEPVKRKVALKLIKPGMDSGQVIARFEAERQALSMMDHVNIARVLDAGTTSGEPGGVSPGRPFFVMELIHGVTITKYCDDNHLTPRERLELFVPVCQAIQHAHQKGIIHRDIKPSNVMITLYDGKPVPKVIDFGVAKATEQKLTERTLFTQYGTMVGTLEYMSPEQAEMSAMGVDTRSDIYSLGVLLYELLTGSTPLIRGRVRGAAYAEVIRLIKEEEPPRPSTRLSESGEALASISAQRQMEPAQLTKLMRGELDWIVMKTLEKDRNRRYETANGFAADVQRYLNDEPVQACPPSAMYRFLKFARRNKVALSTAAVISSALVLGTVMSTWQAVRATRAKHDAEVAQHHADQARDNEARQRAAAELARKEEAEQRGIAEQQRNRAVDAEKLARSNEEKAHEEEQNAKRSADEARAVLEFFQEKVLAAARPESQEGGLGVAATIRDSLDAAEPQIGPAFQAQPLVEGSIRNTLGVTYMYLGEAELAIRQFERSRQLRSDNLSSDHPDVLTSMNNLALAYQDVGNLDQAMPLHKQTLEKRLAKLGPDHSDTLISMNNLAMAYQDAGKLDQAVPLFEKTLEKTQAKLGPDDPSTLISMHNLANAYQAAGNLDQALPLLEQTLEKTQAKLGPDHPDTLGSMNSLAIAYKDADKLDQAVPLLEQTLEKTQAKLGPDHPHRLITMNNLASAYQAAGKLDQALPLFEQTLEKTQAKLGPDHRDTLRIMNNLALAYQDAGKLDQAVPLFEKTVEKTQAKLGPDHPSTLTITNNLAVAYQAVGKLDQALPLYEKTLEKTQAKLGPDHPDTLRSMNSLAWGYQGAGRLREAEPLFREAVTGARHKLGFAHPNTQTAVRNLVECYATLRQPEKAEPIWRELAAFWKEKAGANSPQYAGQLASLGLNLLQQQKPADAEPPLRECLLIREKTDPDAWTTFNTKSLLGGSLLGQKKYAEAEPLLLAGCGGMQEREANIPAPSNIRLTEAIERLVQLYDAWDQKDKAEEWRKKLTVQAPGKND